MMKSVPLIQLFLSSPGDVGDEREIVRKIARRVSNRRYFRGRLRLNVIAWEDPSSSTPMPASLTPQEAIKRGLPLPADCEVTIVLFWSRMGTPFTDTDGKDYKSGTEWELLNALSSSYCTPYIYRRMDTPDYGDTDSKDYDANRAQHKEVMAFFESEIFMQDGKIKASVNQYKKPSDFEELFENNLEEIIDNLLKRYEQNTVSLSMVENVTASSDMSQRQTCSVIEWDKNRSPFPGLHAFTADDAMIFFGRGRETDLLVERIRQNRFVGVVGASGSGKSSLVAAGLIPRLRGNAISGKDIGSKDWILLQMKPGADPFENLYDALLSTFPILKPNPLEAGRYKKNFVADCQADPKNLHETLIATLEGKPEWVEILWYIDQFEELFTVTPEAMIKPFAKLLECVSKSESKRFRVVITMRSDFYHRCVDVSELAHLLEGGSFPMGVPSMGALYQMITRPAELVGLEFDNGLPDQILKDTGDQPGSLALMAYALDELYQIIQSRENGRISFADYEGMGRVQEAITIRAESAFESLTGTEADKIELLGRVFRMLANVDDRGVATRKQAIYAEKMLSKAEADLIEVFVKARLLVKEGKDKEVMLEVAHEALLREWGRLADWINQRKGALSIYQQFERDARIWKNRDQEDDARRPLHEQLKFFEDACQILGIKGDSLPQPLKDYTEPEQERLYRELEEIETTHERRCDIGDRLAVIGDTRYGVGVKEGIPEIAWLAVEGSGGEKDFMIASVNSVSELTTDDSDSYIYSQAAFESFSNLLLETFGKFTRLGVFTIHNFFIAKYPITYAQYQTFIEAEDGYHNRQWWYDFPDEYQPQHLPRSYVKRVNVPRDNVSWYQAVAFSRWLDAQLWQRGGLPDPKMRVRLLTEWEWQWAAQNGLEKRTYPWGDWDDYARANTSEAGLIRSTAVGIYPHGKAECGAMDMSGNLWEWCLNNKRNIKNINGHKNKVLRGGTSIWDRSYARSTYQNSYHPDGYSNIFGFRVCCCPDI